MTAVLRRPVAILFSVSTALGLGWATLTTIAAPPPPAATDNQHPVDLTADTGSEKATKAGKIVTLSHNVRIKSEDSTMLTDLAMWNDTTKIADSPGKLKIDDAQNTVIGNKGVAFYNTRDAKITGAVQITVRPKPSDANAAEGSARREFKSPVLINCDNVDYNWKRKVAIATGHLIFYYEDRTVTADRATYLGNEEKVVLQGHVHYTRKNGDHGDSEAADAILKEGAEEYHVPKGSQPFSLHVKVNDEDNDKTKSDTTIPPAANPPKGPTPLPPTSPSEPNNNTTPPPATPITPPATPPTTPGTTPPATGNPTNGPATPTKP